jgi:hypothetical protein
MKEPGLKGRYTDYERQFDSLAAFAALVPSKTNASMHKDQMAGCGHGRFGSNWLGPVKSESTARELFRTGWPEGVERLRKMRAADLSAAQSVKRVRCRSDQGDELDIHRVWSGRFDQAWSATTRGKRTHTRHVHILATTQAACSIDQDSVYWRGAAATRLADALENAGYSVAITGLTVAGDTNEDYNKVTFAYPVKGYDQPLSLANVAAALCCVAWHRILGFTAFVSIPGTTHSYYGMNRDEVIEGLIEDYAKHRLAGEHVIKLPSNMWSEKKATEWLNEQIATMNQSNE